MAAIIAPERQDRASQYLRIKYRLDLIGYGLTLLYPVLLVVGGSRWLGAMLESSVLFVGVLVLGRGLFQLPVEYARYRHKRRFGATELSVAAWIGENLPFFVLGLLGQGVVALLLLSLWKAAPATWYLWVTAVVVAVLLLFSLAAPALMHGWITESTPLPDGELKRRLMVLARKAGVSIKDVYVSNAAPGLLNMEAGWVSGFGASRRITLDRETLNAHPSDEIEATVGHELGHCVYNHSAWALLCDAAMAALIVLGPSSALAPISTVLGFGGLTREALPLLALLGIGGFLIVWPLRYAITRACERAADAFALRLTGKPEPYIRRFKREAVGPEPPRWVYYYRHRHPLISDRIADAEEFDRRQRGEQQERRRQQRQRRAAELQKTPPQIDPEGFWVWRRP
ncbi:MAG: yhfN [Symbiobacteriaceae bacterium]|nr:yhfN [Symbiobacteriaceae bacterium]